MKNYVLIISLTTSFVLSNTVSMNAQEISPESGYTTQIGNIVSMLNDLKRRVISSVTNLDQKETDFLLDEDANRVGALILHLAATEKYYQIYTFENRGFNREEKLKWETALMLGDHARETIVDKPIEYYLEIWDEVRDKSLKLLKSKDDKWFNDKVKGSNMNNHWAWYHVMEHQANHMGQIRLIIKRIE